MSIDRADGDEHARAGATRLLALARSAPSLARLRLAAAMDDFFLSEDGRLDDRTRASLAALVNAIVGRTEGEIRAGAANALASEPSLAAVILHGPPALDALIAGGHLREDALLEELLARVRLDQLAAALPFVAPERPDQPSLLVRLSADPNPAVARPAMALMAAESRRRAFADTGRLTRSELPAELHHRLLWLVAAAIRAGIADPATTIDMAIAEAATRALASHDEADSLEGAAMQLAVGIDARPDELGELLLATLQDRRPVLLVAVLARALRVDATRIRDIATTADAAALWLALRAAGLDRSWVSRIGLALADADPRRDVDQLPDTVDAVMTLSVAEADQALASLRLPVDYRRALDRIGQQ